ncbi:hypothetical protein [Aestuariibacter sp. A3R04]|uniref:hypothetical protein n=1 Tax=Aestuariibacter sp. A3R04 TaxID=2841571 RepID=UPI001C08185D|nr:hypothetical protein [Aestuariibacter sp. A3R04]MBU3021933.1 hypothetical protein [Aestuariibacter sp. A3R04]
MDIHAIFLPVLSTLSIVFLLVFILCLVLFIEKRNAIEVVSHYDSLLKAKLNRRELNSITILEPDPYNRVAYILKLIPYTPFLPCAGILKHLKNSLQQSDNFVKKCNANDRYIIEASVDDILAQRDACITFYFMAEMLTCNSRKYRSRIKAWGKDTGYVKKYFIDLIPNLVQIRDRN